MKNLSRLAVVITLALVFATSALAGETNTPPCPNTGETNTPPCANLTLSDNQLEATQANTGAASTELERVAFEALFSVFESLLAF